MQSEILSLQDGGERDESRTSWGLTVEGIKFNLGTGKISITNGIQEELNFAQKRNTILL